MTAEIGPSEACGTGAFFASSIGFCISDWRAETPTRHRKEDWIAWYRGDPDRPGSRADQREPLPPALRRRISPIGQQAFRAVSGLGVARDNRFVFCSRHGEFTRTSALLGSLAANEALSPADFSLAVHNALPGLLSIAWKNEAGHIAIAAGPDSFGFGLLEAAVIARQGGVILIYCDEPLPGAYADFGDDGETSLALALHIVAPRGDGNDIFLAFDRPTEAAPPQAATSQALDFVRFLISGECERVSSGDQTRWQWRRASA